jgi:hypothetical protein
VRQKHVDFLLCDREKVGPVLVIELDDASHQREDVRERDGAKDAILQAAGLPILRVTERRGVWCAGAKGGDRWADSCDSLGLRTPVPAFRAMPKIEERPDESQSDGQQPRGPNGAR